MPAGEFGKWKGGKKKHLESRSDGCERKGKTAKGVGNRAIKGLTKKLEWFSEREKILLLFFGKTQLPISRYYY